MRAGRRSLHLRIQILLSLALVGCAGGGATGDAEGAAYNSPLLVMAAASLGEAMSALLEAFEAESGTSADLALGATGNLAAQIVNGAPADLFFSADVETVDRLAARGAIDAASVQTFALGELVLVWRPGLPPPSDARAIVDEHFEVIVIANPEIAPYGAAARQALRTLGVWEEVQPRIVLGESVTQAYQFVRTGNADVGLVARSIALPDPGSSLPIDPALHAPLRHAAGILSGSTHPAAAAFLDFVLGPSGQAILGQHGFATPGG